MPDFDFGSSFVMYRRHDEGGVSGTGVVLQGHVFPGGKLAIHWGTPKPNGSIAVWDCLADFLNIHVVPHQSNDTLIVWSDGNEWNNKEMIEYVGEMQQRAS